MTAVSECKSTLGSIARRAWRIRIAIASLLHRRGASERAIPWLERVIADAPLCENISEFLLELLKEAEEWEKGALVARRKVTLKGENYPRLALSRFALSAGQLENGLSAAIAARNLATDDAERSSAGKLVSLTIDDGAKLPAGRTKSAIAPVTTAEFKQALKGVAFKVSADYRMGYWKKPSGTTDHDWISQPERRAQEQLRMWLDAKFEGRVNTLEEVGAGAGRLDLLVQLAGGTQVILELKMLRRRYGTTYAASGADQIIHYMENRGIGLGYLVTFDARFENNGEPLIDRFKTSA